MAPTAHDQANQLWNVSTRREQSRGLTLAQPAPALLPTETQHALQRGPCRIPMPAPVHGIGSLRETQAGLERRVVIGQRRGDGQGRERRGEEGMAGSSFEPTRQKARVGWTMDECRAGERGRGTDLYADKRFRSHLGFRLWHRPRQLGLTIRAGRVGGPERIFGFTTPACDLRRGQAGSTRRIRSRGRFLLFDDVHQGGRHPGQRTVTSVVR